MWQRSTAHTVISRGAMRSRSTPASRTHGDGPPWDGARQPPPQPPGQRRRPLARDHRHRRQRARARPDRPGHLVDRGGHGGDAADLHGRAAAADHRLGVRPELADAAGRPDLPRLGQLPGARRARRLLADADGAPDRHRRAVRLPGRHRRRRGRGARPQRLHDHAAGHLRRRDRQLRGDGGGRRAAVDGPGGGGERVAVRRRPVGGIEPGVRALAFKNTAAAWFTDSRRQLSGVVPGRHLRGALHGRLRRRQAAGAGHR